RNARDFAVRIPFVGALLDVHLEYRKSFVLFSLNLQLPSVDMQLEAARNFQRLLFGCLGFLFLAKRRQSFRFVQIVLEAIFVLNRWIFPLERLFELVVVVEKPVRSFVITGPRKSTSVS